MPRYEDVTAKKPSDLHERYADWLQEHAGYKVDLKSVQLAVSLRHVFQKSDENQLALKDQRDLAEDRAAEKIERAAKRAEDKNKAQAAS